MNDALWLVLDELVYAHNRVAPFSIFAMTTKPTTRETAQKLLAVMPAFAQRLRAREKEWALLTPVKRRILFKLFCVGAFVNGKITPVRPLRRRSDESLAIFGRTRDDSSMSSLEV